MSLIGRTPPLACFHTSSSSRPTTAQRHVLVSALPLATPLPAWNSQTNAVSTFSAFSQQALIKPFADCGDVEDFTNNSPGFANETDCNIACSGDAIHICGGPNRLSVCTSVLWCLQHFADGIPAIQYYTWNGSLSVWHTPEVTGEYEVCARFGHYLPLAYVLLYIVPGEYAGRCTPVSSDHVCGDRSLAS